MRNTPNIFLKWWLFATLISVGLVALFVSGVLHHVWNYDITKLSFVILGAFCTETLWLGMQCRKWEKHQMISSKWRIKNFKYFERCVESGWFLSDVFLTIGMIGTVIGFITMLAGFSSVDLSDSQSAQDLIINLGSGMSTALYTTLSGLICSLLLKVQCFNMEKLVETDG